jgi:hypothetical protein
LSIDAQKEKRTRRLHLPKGSGKALSAFPYLHGDSKKGELFFEGARSGSMRAGLMLL